MKHFILLATLLSVSSPLMCSDLVKTVHTLVFEKPITNPEKLISEVELCIDHLKPVVDESINGTTIYKAVKLKHAKHMPSSEEDGFLIAKKSPDGTIVCSYCYSYRPSGYKKMQEGIVSREIQWYEILKTLFENQ